VLPPQRPSIPVTHHDNRYGTGPPTGIDGALLDEPEQRWTGRDPSQPSKQLAARATYVPTLDCR